MKWSEQMRVLQSEDEHYNQLVYDVDANALYINDKLIATLNEQHALDPNTFLELKEKYPYIDDKNFLLNCLFKIKERTTNATTYGRPTFVHYGKSENISYINITTQYGGTGYIFTFITTQGLHGPE